MNLIDAVEIAKTFVNGPYFNACHDPFITLLLVLTQIANSQNMDTFLFPPMVFGKDSTIRQIAKSLTTQVLLCAGKQADHSERLM